MDSLKVERKKIADLLSHRHSLVRELKKLLTTKNGQIVFSFDTKRVTNVLLKLARCHAAFELNEPRIDEPEEIWFLPLICLSEEERLQFESEVAGIAGWPEVGSRAMQRVLVFESEPFREDWITVQPGRYRFTVSQTDGVRVRIVIREYLACEIRWI